MAKAAPAEKSEKESPRPIKKEVPQNSSAVNAPVKGVEQFAISNSTEAASAFEGHKMRKLEGAWQAAADVTVARGTWEVPMTQPLARLAFYLLEPASDDGLVNWNALDEQLTGAKAYPILRKK